MVRHSSFSMMVIERRFPHRLKVLSCEQWLRTGRMDSSWKSLIPHCSKFSSWREAATCSRRTWRSTGLKSVSITPLRSRPFSWRMFGHWDRWIKSESVSQQLVIERLSKGVFRHLGRKQAIRSEKPGWHELKLAGSWFAQSQGPTNCLKKVNT